MLVPPGWRSPSCSPCCSRVWSTVWPSGSTWPTQGPGKRRTSSRACCRAYAALDETCPSPGSPALRPPPSPPCRATVWLSTAPSEPLTRWSQIRCLLQTPLYAKVGQTLSGTVLLEANDRYRFKGSPGGPQRNQHHRGVSMSMFCDGSESSTCSTSRQSYDIIITATVDQSGFRSGNVLDLKDPFFR